MSQALDIVVPVFNVTDTVAACLESVFNVKTDIPHHITVIDDASTESAMGALLKELKHKYPDRITVLQNGANVGFVQTANRGIACSSNDVILLNSDTIVFDWWLEGLMISSQSQPNVASVTPLSNRASIYSIIENAADMLLTKGLLHQFAQSLRDATDHLRPVIPTGVGFCFLMTRKTIDTIGVFDPAFDRGYGEENDWCMRAAAAGFCHVLDDSTFVYHKGGSSMIASGDISSPDAITIPANEAMLSRKHPVYADRVRAFNDGDIIFQSIRKAAKRIAENMLELERKNIAFLLHHPINRGFLGGTELHVSDLVSELSRIHNCFVISPCKNGLQIQRFFQKVADYSVTLCDTHDVTSLTRAFREILREENVTLLHVHHIIDTSFKCIDVADEEGIPIVYTIHDYYALSPTYTLLREDETFRGIPKDGEICDVASGMTYAEWREPIRESLEMVDAIIAPSQSALFVFQSVFRDLPAHTFVIEHGTDPFPGAPVHQDPQKKSVCFLGKVHLPQKGKNTVSRVAKLLAEQGVSVSFVGTSSLPDGDSTLSHANITYYGQYRRSDLPTLLSAIAPNLIGILSSYPETYCYVLSEAWQLGIPTVVTPLGALWERAKGSGVGFVLDTDDPEYITTRILSFLEKKSRQLERQKSGLLPLPTNEQMARDTEKVYAIQIKRPRPHGKPHSPPLPNFLIIGAQKCGTTWLWTHLGNHPDIYLPPQTETEFFSRSSTTETLGTDGYRHTCFAHYRGERAIGEKTASYFHSVRWEDNLHAGYNPARNIRETLGEDVRLILALRSPVDRAISAYENYRRYGDIPKDSMFFDNARSCEYIEAGFYARILKEWLTYFPMDRMRILILEEDIAQRPRATLRALFSFLDVCTDVPVVYADRKIHAKKEDYVPSDDTLNMLYDTYAPDIDDLSRMIDRDLSCWSRPRHHFSTPLSHHARKPALLLG